MLRHLTGLLAGLALAPPLWLALAWACGELYPNVLRGGAEGFSPLALAAVGTLMAVGVVCGFLAGARVTPLAAFVAGAVPLAYALWPVLAPGSVDAVLPGWIPPDSLFHPRGPGLPAGLLVGALLFISAVVPSRWRSYRAGDPPPAPLPVPAPAPAPAGRGGPAPRGTVDDAAEPVGAYPDDAYTGDPYADDLDGDPAKTTTPLRRGRAADAPWQGAEPADGEPHDTREFHRGDRR
ncbi:hypothetical protein ACFPZ0_24870 [Streptomonospora nanhaiensis]|uniref:Uncharacterized protein n=1 Tax=Streptomonospora nanhaiensis TaxID=1323731 RepID=A0A853BTW9_9ACTN|nr:hypothetical protein [Streptomonospora nanhaiensis]MBV2367083.1 hypothetical protein [Streptomonospora nanhaiensis]MBX9391288.1 hypothetical protein [Streptomonospora nanhaiensis]NYI97722.1 hypothetical protein [Streptomonospora nanhaiensis]